ncbi:hypothetical protein ACN38_g975 [Penicillium nordicum]|uniref:Uncharacterized protein n=1 Tax=Penicillium nordicum TaxID=229535 RepID=A0A0M9WK81_9EURO|nr:hypothetical protein ACN38_g975 [Penicillium nordicum]
MDTHVRGLEVEQSTHLDTYLVKLESIQKRTHESQPGVFHKDNQRLTADTPGYCGFHPGIRLDLKKAHKAHSPTQANPTHRMG